MTMISYRYRDMSKPKNAGFLIEVEDEVENEEYQVGIYIIDNSGAIVDRTSKSVSKEWVDKVVKYVHSCKNKIMPLSTWLVNYDATDFESRLWLETDEWNREVYCYTLGHLTDYEHLKYSRKRETLYEVFKGFSELLKEVGLLLEVNKLYFMNK